MLRISNRFASSRRVYSLFTELSASRHYVSPTQGKLNSSSHGNGVDSEPVTRIVRTVNFPVDEKIGLKLFVKKSMLQNSAIMLSLFSTSSFLSLYDVATGSTISLLGNYGNWGMIVGGIAGVALNLIPPKVYTQTYFGTNEKSTVVKHSTSSNLRKITLTISMMGLITPIQEALTAALMGSVGSVYTFPSAYVIMLMTNMFTSSLLPAYKMPTIYTPAIISVLLGGSIHTLLWATLTPPFLPPLGFENAVDVLFPATIFLGVTNHFAQTQYKGGVPDHLLVGALPINMMYVVIAWAYAKTWFFG